MSICYYEKTAYIRLSTGQISAKVTDPELAARFLGGRGLGLKLLMENTDNMILTTGPFTCGLGPTAGRCCIAAKSPVTGRLCASNSGASWGKTLKFAGWDAIVLEGNAPALSYLFIQDDHIELCNASFLSGKMTDEATDLLKEKHGSDIAVLTIGPAGEALRPNAAILQDQKSAAGRNGLGSVMGRKNLKAIVISASRNDIAPISSCQDCLLPCGRRFRKNEEDPELTRCNRLGIDATAKSKSVYSEKKVRHYQSMGREDLLINAVIDSIGLCMFATKYLTITEIASLLTAITGSTYTENVLMDIGEEIISLEDTATP